MTTKKAQTSAAALSAQLSGSSFPEKTGSAYILPSDFPDPDIIRVDDTYYLVSTTMHMTPGAVILRSHNLLDWEFCSYVFDSLDGTDGQTLADNKGIYGRGMWAACIRHHADKFWVSFVANDTHKSYLYIADEITGSWKKQPIEGFYHDMSVLFDDDGKAWIVSGNRELYLTEMKADLSGPLPDGFNDVIIREMEGHEGLGHEGSHIYKIDGKYYIFTIDWPCGKPRTENCFTAEKITGPWTGRSVLSSEFGGWHSGCAQGGIVDTPDGRWYAVVFQDHGALGRTPVLVSVRFEDGWPVFGVPTALVTVPDLRPGYKYAPLWGNAFTAPSAYQAAPADKAPAAFKAGSATAPWWQWNHIHDARLAQLTESTLSITTDKLVKNPVQAANTLTQRTWGLECAGSITLSAAELNDGDVAGLMALEGEYAFIGIAKKAGSCRLVTARHQIPYEGWKMGVHDDEPPTFTSEEAIPGSEAELRLEFSLYEGKEHVTMFWRAAPDALKADNASSADQNRDADKAPSADKTGWLQAGDAAPLRFTLDQFVGVRFALFCYSTEKTGGKATFRNFALQISKLLP